MTMSSTASIPFMQRINFRVLTFVVVIGGLLGYPLWHGAKALFVGPIQQVGEYKKVNLKALGNFPFYGEWEEIPAMWRALDGEKVLLEGEVFAPNEAGDRMTQFQLVWNIEKCCFEGEPRVQERVFAIVPPEMKQRNLNMQGARVYGTLHVKIKRDEGEIISVYELDVERIERRG
jgi:hypothetical protein